MRGARGEGGGSPPSGRPGWRERRDAAGEIKGDAREQSGDARRSHTAVPVPTPDHSPSSLPKDALALLRASCTH